MMKRILVPLDPSPFSESAVSYACELAAHHHSEITGLVIIDEPGIHDSVAPYSPGSAHMAERAELRMGAEAYETLGRIQKSFALACDAAGIAHRSIERQGDPVEIIACDSAYYDLLVIGQRTYFHFQTSDEPGKTLSKLLGQLATPILAVPKNYSPFGSRVEAVIAFDGSPAAIRSMRQFIQNTVSTATDLVILTATDDMADAAEIAEPAEEYMRAYGFTSVRAEWTPEKIQDAIDDRYINDAEIIVAGMHSKKGLFRFHVGSLADHLVSEARIPVFIGQ